MSLYNSPMRKNAIPISQMEKLKHLVLELADKY